MKVLLRRNISRLGNIGDVVNVKPGHARNYLIPQRLGVEPTEGNLKAVEGEKKAYLAELARQRAELETQAKLLEGKEVSIVVRANEEGHLYGSVGPAQIAAALAEEGTFVDSQYIRMDEPIRRVDKHDVTVRFSEEVSATIHVWVVPAHDDKADADKGADNVGGDDDEEDAPD